MLRPEIVLPALLKTVASIISKSLDIIIMIFFIGINFESKNFSFVTGVLLGLKSFVVVSVVLR